MTTQYILTQIRPNDILVVNETKVIPARIYSECGLEILFIENQQGNQWQVLCPARKWPKGQKLILPDGVTVSLVKTGLPQTVETSRAIDVSYFIKHGDMPLPPYIQEARSERRSRFEDQGNYQTDWAEQLGSLAAPTASLHFSASDLDKVRSRGAEVVKICLHVGLGTFLPIHSDNLDDHVMHSESVAIDAEAWQSILETKKRGGDVWALGSTVTRALESMALGHFELKGDTYVGQTDLFIRPGFEYQIVSVLMTNFHQPESTLVAMVMAFAGVENMKTNYQWAIDRHFRLFSYGDLSVWKR